MKQKKQWNHMLDVAFTIVTSHKDYTKIKTDDILAAMEQRLNYLKANPQEVAEAFGYSDSYEVFNN